MPDLLKLLSPSSVAVIGASSDTQGLRGRIFQIIRSHPFQGRVYPVSRSAAEVQGVKAYPSVEALPETPDLAILIVPATYVPAELERCGRAGIKAVVILSSGFAEEAGETGARMQAEIRATARRYDMAVAGPNAEGFANIAAAFCPTFSPVLDASAGPILPTVPLGRGQVSVISQSGGMGFAFFDRARPRNLLFRYVMTTGNEAALEVADVLDAMLDEGQTDVYLLLIEDVKTPQKFMRAAQKALAAGKPLIVCKIGRSEPGGRAVLSHTAAFAGSHAAYRAMFERYGVIEGNDLDEMLDLAVGFLACGDRLPKGRRVGICTASGGAGIWMTDACADAGLDVPVLDDATRARIDVKLPSYASSLNPVDITAQGVHQFGYAEFSRLIAQSPEVDGVITVISARRAAFLEHDLDKLGDLAANSPKPVLMWTYTLPAERSVEILNGAGYALFTSTHGCARTMRALADYRTFRERAVPVTAAAPLPARERVRAALAGPGTMLCEYRARPLLAAYGIGAENAGRLARSAEEAIAAAQAIGGPVALKVQSNDIPHKTEAGAVLLNLSGNAVGDGFARVLAAAKDYAPSAAIDGVLVQPMASAGREVILGINRDPTWGPLLMVGLGGVLVEAIGDVALAPVPLDEAAARALIGRLKGAAVLGPYRGAPAADIEALTAVMVKLSQFAADHADSIAQVDLNPVIVHAAGGGVSIVDALIVKHGAPAAQRAAAE